MAPTSSAPPLALPSKKSTHAGKSSDSARAKTSSRKSKAASKERGDGGEASSSAAPPLLSSIAEGSEGPKPSVPVLLCAISRLVQVAGTKALQLRAEFDLSSDKAGEVCVVEASPSNPRPPSASRVEVEPTAAPAVDAAPAC